MVELSSPTQRTARLHTLHALWHKYGLIVVGNVVFFALLYFLQYRPNSREARATELLSLAQQQETEQRLEAAEVLYTRILGSYEDCEAAGVAQQRLPKVQALVTKRRETQAPLPEACAARLDIRALLALQPSFYLAELVAGYFPEVKPAEREAYFAKLDAYVWTALNSDGVPLSKLRASPAFRAGELRQRYFEIKVHARFDEDVVYDDFKLRNDGYFTLHHVVVELTVTQGDKSESASVRVAELPPRAEIDVLELAVASDGGSIEVRGNVASDEGNITFKQRL